MGKPKSRGNGEGTIFRRSDGRWVGAVSLGPGRRKKQFYGKTKREVQEKVKQAIRELEQGVAVDKPDPTLDSFMWNWLEKEHLHKTPIARLQPQSHHDTLSPQLQE